MDLSWSWKGSRALLCGSRREAAVRWHAGGGSGGLGGGPAGGAHEALSQRAEGTVPPGSAGATLGVSTPVPSTGEVLKEGA